MDFRLLTLHPQDLGHPSEQLVEAGVQSWGLLEGLKLPLEAEDGGVVVGDALPDALAKKANQLLYKYCQQASVLTLNSILILMLVGIIVQF